MQESLKKDKVLLKEQIKEKEFEQFVDPEEVPEPIIEIRISELLNPDPKRDNHE